MRSEPKIQITNISNVNAKKNKKLELFLNISIFRRIEIHTCNVNIVQKNNSKYTNIPIKKIFTW